MRTLVIQSSSAAQAGGWIGACLASVERWAGERDYDYRFVGDEIFAAVPDWYRDKVGRKLPVATDYARLVLLQRALAEGYRQAIWMDADLLIFDSGLHLDFAGSCAFGQEHWVQQNAGGALALRRNVHNAVCVFRQECPVLPFLIHSVASLIRRVDPAHIAPQLVGPKLLNALHPLCDFTLLPQAGALSPLVQHELLAGAGPALQLLRARAPVPLQAANLCASLVSDEVAAAVVAHLLAHAAL